MARRKAHPPAPDPGGLYYIDPDTGKEYFSSWEEVHQTCKFVMGLPDHVCESMLGKMHFTKDPTYNLRRKK